MSTSFVFFSKEQVLLQRVAELERDLAAARSAGSTAAGVAGAGDSSSVQDAVVRAAALEVSVAALEAENNDLLSRLEERGEAEAEAATRIAEEMKALSKELVETKAALAAQERSHAVEVQRLTAEAISARDAARFNASSDSSLVDALRYELAQKDAAFRRLEQDIADKDSAAVQMATKLSQALADLKSAESRSSAFASKSVQERATLEAQVTSANAELAELRRRVSAGGGGPSSSRRTELYVPDGDEATAERVRELESLLYSSVTTLKAEKKEKDLLQQR